jgi:ATP-dependent DNA helicase RecG
MSEIKKNSFLFDKVSSIKGVGIKLTKYLKNKKIEKINDLIWNLPYSYTDRSESTNLNNLEVGKVFTIKIKVIKYNFPRMRNLPNKINCEDGFGKIDLIFFNSREGYIKKILPLNEWAIVSGKIGYFRNKYQITNPSYVLPVTQIDFIKKKIPKYSLTEGLNEKTYRKIIENVLNSLSDIYDWHTEDFLKKMNFLNWKKSILKIHQIEDKKDINSREYRRLAFDEIFAHLLILTNNRKKIKKIKKKSKKFEFLNSFKVQKSLSFELTKSQKKVLVEINQDLKSKNKMFRLVQGDVGSGKTIVSLLAAANVIDSGYQVAFMAPTEILARQHYELSKKLFSITNFNIEFISGKTDLKLKKKIYEDLKNKKIDLIIGTHSLFQKKTIFKKLGFIIIDEQHKFGVKQRMDFSKKGGSECDVLLMSATPIPRTMMLTIYGDMDISIISEKPLKRKPIITLSKPEEKINELWPFINKQIKNNNQIFWVCPLINESKFLNYSSAVKRFEFLNTKFPNKVGLIHGAIDKEKKDFVLNKFLKREIDILVSTTVIEVGIDFPNSNLIIIENANKFGLAQLHQLRGRVGRGEKQGTCILLYKGSLSKNAIKRIKILKSSDDGFYIAEQDMRLRGYGDIIGFQQSGIKYFKIADPVHHTDLFKIAEEHVKLLDNDLKNTNKYDFLLKLFDQAEIINEVTTD